MKATSTLLINLASTPTEVCNRICFSVLITCIILLTAGRFFSDSSSYYSGWNQYGYGRRSRAPWYERIDDYALDRYYGYDDEEDDDEEEYEEE